LKHFIALALIKGSGKRSKARAKERREARQGEARREEKRR
jgi:hypothetical protein